jgi:hypothetical protein
MNNSAFFSFFSRWHSTNVAVTDRHIYVKGVDRYRKLDQDLGQQILTQNEQYFADLHKPSSSDEFIDRLNKMQPEDFRGQMPLFYGHFNPYGKLLLNMLERIIIE